MRYKFLFGKLSGFSIDFGFQIGHQSAKHGRFGHFESQRSLPKNLIFQSSNFAEGYVIYFGFDEDAGLGVYEPLED